MTNTFDYEQFINYYEQLVKTVGQTGDSDNSTINGAVKNCDNVITQNLSYAEDSAWAGDVINRWQELKNKLNNDLQRLDNLLSESRKAAEAYHNWELSQQTNNQ